MTGRTALLLSLLIGASASASARTWHVEKDGSGDFTVIQAAVDAASVGDTIRIGPGEFRESRPFSTPGWTEDVNVAVTTDRLTIVGSGANVTVIGPATRDHTPGVAPKAILEIYVATLCVSNVSIENAYHGMYSWKGHLDFAHNSITNCSDGIIAWTEDGAAVIDCQFSGNGTGVEAVGPAANTRVSGCAFQNNVVGISFDNGSTNSQAHDCEFRSGAEGLQVTVSSDAQISNCAFDGMTAVGIYVSTGSRADLISNVIRNGRSSLYVSANSTVTGSGDVLACGDNVDGTTRMDGSSLLTFHGSHILNTARYSVILAGYPNSPGIQLDLTNNYWGTSGSATIADWIYDGHDDPNIHAFVNYEPFANAPLGAEQKTWGELKALYAK